MAEQHCSPTHPALTQGLLEKTVAHNNRTEHRQAVQSMRGLMQRGPVTVESGPCAGMIVKDEKTLLEYSKKLDLWFFPPLPTPYIAR